MDLSLVPVQPASSLEAKVALWAFQQLQIVLPPSRVNECDSQLPEKQFFEFLLSLSGAASVPSFAVAVVLSFQVLH